MWKRGWLVCLLLLVCSVSLVKSTRPPHLHPALDFYKTIERGALEGVPFSPLFCRSHVDWFIGGTLDVYPCEDEPYLSHANIKNSRNNMDVAALPYNTPFEGGVGNFFTMYSPMDDNLVPKYIGPVSTHIFPPPADLLEEWLLRMPRALVTEEEDGSKKYTYRADYHFDIDIGRSYEYPRDASFRYNIDEPIYLYDDDTQQFHIERLWGTTRLMRSRETDSCRHSQLQVNEPSDTTQTASCDGAQESVIHQALAQAKQMARQTKDFLQHVPSDCIKSDTVTTWFGQQATESENLASIRAVFEWVASFDGAWFVCEEKENEWFTNTTLDTKALNDKYLEPHLQRIRAREGEEEKPVPSQEVVDDPRGLKNLELYCTPGMTSWLIPRDASRTVHLCPLFFTLDDAQQGRVLLDTFIRFHESLLDILLGAEESKNLAATQPTRISLQNAPSYVYLAEAIGRTTEEEDYIIADL